MPAPTLAERTSGVLLHPTSLPGPHGSGDLGPAAFDFATTLAAAGQRWWQMLPVAPPGYGDSPYSAESAFAGSPLLLSLEALHEEGLLSARDLEGGEQFSTDRVDFPAVRAYRQERLHRAFEAFRGGAGGDRHADFEGFCHENRAWLDDYALFRALKQAHEGEAWTSWEPPLRDRHPWALAAERERLAEAVAFHRFEQYLFDRQWKALRAHAASRGLGLLGDVPIFVAHDSADVWQHRELFHLDEQGNPEVVAGVPPDYFSADGQRWGNPLYRWKRLRSRGYSWWIDRLRVTLGRFDAVRLDHFIGFHRYWEIPASCPTAVEGRWAKGPGAHFFQALRDALGSLPLVAEDLGAVTPEVLALRDRFKLPGIVVLQFAFGNDDSAGTFLPHNHRRRSVVYTGTHDNNTTVGWFHGEGEGAGSRSAEQIRREQRAVLEYLGGDGREIHWGLVRAALQSVARTAIVPVQDLLGLGAASRMNRPGIAGDNWTFRMRAGALTPAIVARLGQMSRIYGRSPRP
jgi:4-alpha-glucanotransferase